jgi:hypothetical protein
MNYQQGSRKMFKGQKGQLKCNVKKKCPSTQIRTEDPLIYSQMLYQLSYGRLISTAILKRALR